MRHSNVSYISFSSESFKRGTGFYLAYMSITFLFQCVIQTRPFLFFSTYVIQRSQLLSFSIHHSNEMLALLFKCVIQMSHLLFFISHVIQTSQLLPFYDASFKRITWSSFLSCVIQTSQCIFFSPLCNSNASIQFLFSSATYRLIICFFQCVSKTNHLGLFSLISFKRITFSLKPSMHRVARFSFYSEPLKRKLFCIFFQSIIQTSQLLIAHSPLKSKS